MSVQRHGACSAELVAEIRSLARPLSTSRDLDALVTRAGAARQVCIGEASHGTSSTTCGGAS